MRRKQQLLKTSREACSKRVVHNRASRADQILMMSVLDKCQSGNMTVTI